MNYFNAKKYGWTTQYTISVVLILLTAFICYLETYIIGYKTVALILLFAVSILAMLFDILPVLLSAVLSALIWDFFFIPPTFTFHIDNIEDLLMFSLYFIIALVNAILTFKIRKEQKKARDKEEKETTIKLYNTLLNSLSHEVRTPISTIIGAVDTLKENKERLSAKNQNDLLNEIDIASLRLNRQVENLLNMSRLESGTLRLKKDWCDVNELLFSIIKKLEIYSSKHNILFNAISNLPLCKLDGGILEQVIYNILFNAIQYTPPNSLIKIDAVIEDTTLVITIMDNGNGIPEELMNKIFQKFYRLPNTKAGGSGLGLSIAKGFVEAHEGELKLENNPEGGAKFTIYIPTEITYLNNLKNESSRNSNYR